MARRNIQINSKNLNLQISTIQTTTNSEVSKTEGVRNSIRVESGQVNLPEIPTGLLIRSNSKLKHNDDVVVTEYEKHIRRPVFESRASQGKLLKHFTAQSRLV